MKHSALTPSYRPDSESSASTVETAHRWMGYPVLFLLALAIYWPALAGEFLWDDSAHVTRAELRGWDGLGRIWFEPGATQQYYPVLHSAFWLEHRLWGDSAVAYHLTNVLLHALNGCLLAALLRRLLCLGAACQTPEKKLTCVTLSWLAAGLFVAHPVCVESVAWISEQKNTLSTAFYLVAAIFYAGFAARRSLASYALGSGFYLLALGTKTTTATLPAALLVAMWWRHGRLEWRRDIIPLLPWFLAAVPAGLMTAWIEKTAIGADLVVPDLTLVERTLLASRTLWFYVGKLVWPADITFFYPLWDVAVHGVRWTGYLLAALGATVALWIFRQRSRAPLAIWLLYGGTLFPALGFFKVFPFQFSYVADHFQYLAIPAAMTGAAAGLLWVTGRAPGLKRVSPWLIGGVVLALAFLSRGHSRLYRNDEVLFRANIAANPSSWMGYRIIAHRIGKNPARRAEAIALFRKALELNPRSAETMAAYGGLLVQEPGHSEEAIALFEEAIRLRPTYAEAHNALANEIVAIPGRLQEAIDHYETALRLRPDFAMAEANLAMALAQLPERQTEALRLFQRALRALPGYAPARFRLAQLLAGIPGRDAEAAEQYFKAIELRPGIPEAHFELATLLMKLSRVSEAARQLDEALRLAPGYVEALNLRGVILAREGRVGEARAIWTRALEIAPLFEPARRNLRALEEQGPR